MINFLSKVAREAYLVPFEVNYRSLSIGRKINKTRNDRVLQTWENSRVGTSNEFNTKLITCKRKEHNLVVPMETDYKFGTLPLASSGWLHRKSKGDWFHINATLSEQKCREAMINVDEYLKELQTLDPPIQIDKIILENLRINLEIKQLSPIQVHSFCKVYNEEHVIIAAETGCGKTLSYLLPLVQRVLNIKRHYHEIKLERELNSPFVIILTPGRELANQIGKVAEKLCQDTGIRIKTILGGNMKQLMKQPEFEDVDIVVASMGAISKLVTTGIYRTRHVRHIVLDEADTLLDDSFNDKLTFFLRKFRFHLKHLQNDQREFGTQFIMVAATMPTNIVDALSEVIDTKTITNVVSPNLHRLMLHVEQRFLRINKSDRPAHLLSIVKKKLNQKKPLIIFSNKTPTCDYISIFLNNNGIKCLNLNGDMLMKIRLDCFNEFQNGNIDVLSTTDMASRGLDTTRARHVINFDFPLHISDYIHRCGRIGRINHFERCVVTNFISSRREIEPVQQIEHAARIGSLLPNVDANIKGIIHRNILDELQMADNNIINRGHRQQEAI